ncbi:MAG: hypothetical protein WC358_00515 [Ignavibacteria bacterium]
MTINTNMAHEIHLNSQENNWNEMDKKLIKAFAEYLFKVLVVKFPVKIELKQSYEDGNVAVSTDLRLAYVLPEERSIIIYCKNRGLLDILRSIAHEVIHMEQQDKGLLDNVKISFYLPDENAEGYGLEYEAYGKSGIIVRNFRAILDKMSKQ